MVDDLYSFRQMFLERPNMSYLLFRYLMLETGGNVLKASCHRHIPE
jgi:hypothetical protein